MKFLRVGPLGQERPALLDVSGNLRDLSDHIVDIDRDSLKPEMLEKLCNIDPQLLPIISNNPRIGACVANVGKFICIGLNYTDHAKESGMEIPKEPVVFMKATSSICGPYDDVIIPPGSQKTDWEVELGIVIGSRAKHVSITNARSHIAGYCVIHDVSERDYQLTRGGQWVKGKSYDRFGPIGPWLVTSDELMDPGNLNLWLDVNGERKQDGNTKNLIFSIEQVISHLSEFMTLEPGDIISTGTPAGVGFGHKPPTYLKTGDIVELGIEGLGTQCQTFVDGGKIHE